MKTWSLLLFSLYFTSTNIWFSRLPVLYRFFKAVNWMFLACPESRCVIFGTFNEPNWLILMYKNYQGSPCRAWAFDELGRYHTRPLQLNWGPKNVYFVKTDFRDPYIDARVLLCGKFEELPGATFLCFAFSTTCYRIYSIRLVIQQYCSYE